MGSISRFLTLPPIAIALALVAGAGDAATPARGSAAIADDPLQTADCRSALATLQVREDAADAAWRTSAASGAQVGAAANAELQAARRLAAHSCLASRADTAAPERSIQAPVVVAPIVVAPVAAPRSGPAHVAHVPPPPPAPAERPSAVTACDPGGCWANDGSRLNRVGPNLWGKHGICTLQGSLLQCP